MTITRQLECGCSVAWPDTNNHAAQKRKKKEHEETCATYKAIRDARRENQQYTGRNAKANKDNAWANHLRDRIRDNAPE